MSASAETAVTEQAVVKTTIGALKVPDPNEANLPAVTVGFTSLRAFELIWRVAKMFASSSIVPERFQGNPANCAIAVEMAQRLGASPIMVMQNLYIVYGNPGWAAKFLIASFNQCGRYTSVRYAFEGTRNKDDWGCRAWAIEKSTNERLEGPLINIELAKAEGWYSRKDSKWKTMPEQMLRYRSAAWFINTVAPEISMGIRTTEEIVDVYDARPNANGRFVVDLDELRVAPAATAATQVTQESAATEEVDKSTGEIIPHFDQAGAIAYLKKAKTLAELDAAKMSIWRDFNETHRKIPLELDDAYNMCKESIAAGTTGKLDL
jgi:hypothetical protein